MISITKADGTRFNPPAQTGRGRKGRFPFRYLEVGDHFIADSDDLPTLKQTITNGRVFGREHSVERGPAPFKHIVTRTA